MGKILRWLRRCEECRRKLTPETTAYLGFSSFKTVCTSCVKKYQDIGLPVSFDTVVFDDTWGSDLVATDKEQK